MTKSGDTLPLRSPPSPSTTKTLRRRRRRRYICLISFLLLLLALATVIAVALILLRPRDPRTQLVSVTVTGVTPRLSVPDLTLSINLTLSIDILVYNPNRASFSYSDGSTILLYRSAQVGIANVLPGRIPSRGSAHVSVNMTLDGTRLAAESGNLLSDAMAGEVVFHAEARIPGRVKLLGFIRHHAVAVSQCHVAVGFPDLRVRRQDCRHHTKL